jgi:hypothetical protein
VASITRYDASGNESSDIPVVGSSDWHLAQSRADGHDSSFNRGLAVNRVPPACAHTNPGGDVSNSALCTTRSDAAELQGESAWQVLAASGLRAEAIDEFALAATPIVLLSDDDDDAWRGGEEEEEDSDDLDDLDEDDFDDDDDEDWDDDDDDEEWEEDLEEDDEDL